MRETGSNGFKTRLIKEIKQRLPGCCIFLADAGYRQGSPDVIVLCDDFWAALEVKGSEKASRRPNQEYYVEMLNKMSFSAFVYPENKEEVLDELQRAVESRRYSRFS